jgi:accessory gene regulator protein AgrB
VELLFNILWLSVSLTLVFTWVRAVRHGHTKHTWSAFVALALLLVLLLPVISMTDDLVAMDGPSEYEHVVRRSEMPLLHLTHDTAALLDTGLLAVLLFLGFAILFSRLSRFTMRFSTHILSDAFVRTTGVRPPPVALIAA